VGFVMATPRSTRFAPIIKPIVGRAVTSTETIPARSSSRLSVAPQRVPVPQVPVTSAAATPISVSRWAISRPNFSERAVAVQLPVVE
jgi:hypothetical protein